MDLRDPTLLASIWRVLDYGSFLSTIKGKLANKFQGKILVRVGNTAETALRRMEVLDKKPNDRDAPIALLDLFRLHYVCLGYESPSGGSGTAPPGLDNTPSTIYTVLFRGINKPVLGFPRGWNQGETR